MPQLFQYLFSENSGERGVALFIGNLAAAVFTWILEYLNSLAQVERVIDFIGNLFDGRQLLSHT